MRRYGFTGSREEPPFAQATALRVWLEAREGELHHGDCIGRDAYVHSVARSLRGWRIVIHPGPSRVLRAFCDGDLVLPVKPNLERNADIVMQTDELVAAPKGPEALRSGTWSTVRHARKLKRPITIFWPDGSVTFENGAGLI